MITARPRREDDDQGYARVYAGNDVENPRMPAINLRLDYDSLPRIILIVKEFGEGRPE